MIDETYRLVKNDGLAHRSIFSHAVIDDIVHQVETAIDNGIEPTMIQQGSSGSYFVRNSSKKVIGVFKPKDEEPYEVRNPKWGKYFHRLCCPCCFGRPCLLNNHGYLSEAGASLIDEALGLNIVPTTRVVALTSTSFNHKKIVIMKSKTKTQIAEKFPDLGRKFHRLGIPPKQGSLQLFVEGYEAAEDCLDRLFHCVLKNSQELFSEFLNEFQKLVILDYIIRNTDRNNSNWLIKYPESIPPGSGDISDGKTDDISIKIAAIDNGLAFPYKHPDQVRAYPYYWSWLDVATLPFTESLQQKMLPLLTKNDFVESIVENLRVLFRMNANFKKSVFDTQMSIMRGQILNLCAALRDSKSPAQLVNMPSMSVELLHSNPTPIPVYDDDGNLVVPTAQDMDSIPNDTDSTNELLSNSHNASASNSSNTSRNKLMHYVAKYWKKPFFKSF